MKEILLSEEGYNQYLSEVEKMKELINNNGSAGSEAYRNAVGDGWHDNFDFEETMRENRTMNSKLKSLREDKKYIKIIKEKNKKDNQVNLNSKVRIQVTYSKDDIEEYDVLLTGNYLPDTENEITEITLNSPIGKAIYQKKENNQINTKINDRNITINILKIY